MRIEFILPNKEALGMEKLETFELIRLGCLPSHVVT